MSELREAAKAALTAYEKFRDVDDIDGLDDAMDRLRAALAKPEVPRYVGDARKHVICVCPDCAATNYREWRPASEPPEDLRRRVIAWRSPPQRQSGTWVEALYDDGAWVTRDGIAHDITHWRDVTPPTEGAK